MLFFNFCPAFYELDYEKRLLSLKCVVTGITLPSYVRPQVLTIFHLQLIATLLVRIYVLPFQNVSCFLINCMANKIFLIGLGKITCGKSCKAKIKVSIRFTKHLLSRLQL